MRLDCTGLVVSTTCQISCTTITVHTTCAQIILMTPLVYRLLEAILFVSKKSLRLGAIMGTQPFLQIVLFKHL